MSLKNQQMKRRWAIDLSGKKPDRSSDMPPPPGYLGSLNQISQAESTKHADQSLVIKKAWDIALSPIKSFPMNAFFLYMSGNVIGIFPIMVVGMMILRTVKALWSTGATFKAIEGNHATMQKLIYLLGNLANVGVCLYKCQSLGILPTHASDWLAFQEPVRQVEYSYGGLSFS